MEREKEIEFLSPDELMIVTQHLCLGFVLYKIIQTSSGFCLCPFCSSHLLFVSVSFTGVLEEREGQRPPVSHRRVSPPGQYLVYPVRLLLLTTKNK